MGELILLAIVVIGIVVLKRKNRDAREQRNIQIGVQKALEEERRKQSDESNHKGQRHSTNDAKGQQRCCSPDHARAVSVRRKNGIYAVKFLGVPKNRYKSLFFKGVGSRVGRVSFFKKIKKAIDNQYLVCYYVLVNESHSFWLLCHTYNEGTTLFLLTMRNYTKRKFCIIEGTKIGENLPQYHWFLQQPY